MLELFNPLDWFMVIVAAYFVLRGLSRGFFGEVGRLLALSVAIGGSIFLYQPVADFLRRVVGKPDFWWETLAFIICFMVLYLCLLCIVGRISKVFYKSSLSLLNRLLGAGLGLFKGAIMCYVLVQLLLMAQPYTRQLDNEYLRQEWASTSWLAPSLLKFGNAAVSLISSEFSDQFRQKGLSGLPTPAYRPSLPANLEP